VIRRVLHLARRFFGTLSARSLTPAEQARVAGIVRPEEAALFWSMGAADQRHCLTSADAVASALPHRRDLVRAALLHDVGKRHSRLGVAGRVIASLLDLLRIPAPGRLGSYLAHGPLGAAELAEAGAEPIVVAFAADHHRSRPPEVDPADWEVLLRSDAD
jgi:putative nucleotidyltransferase with HDIG domain